MKDFNALIRDTLHRKNPTGSWQLGRNMLLTKGVKSVANEDGIKFSYLVNGTILGVIATNSHVVYFSKNEDGTDEIGVVNNNNDTPIYITIIKTALLNFQYNCPIEGIFIYNHKNELSVEWSDGVKPNSNPPKAMNLTNPPLQLNGDGTLVDDNEFNKIFLFPNLTEASITSSYLVSGAIDGYNAYITYAYVYEDNSMTPYFSSNNVLLLGSGYDNIDRNGIRLNFSGLDTNFTKLRIGLVIKKDETLFGYESHLINYTGTDKTVDIETLSNYTTTAPENIIIEKSIFTKVNTITKNESQVVLGNVHTREHINFQKYANLLTLKPYRYVSADPQVPSLLPDEVYAMYVQLQYLDGSYSEGYHIPGRVATGTEKDDLTGTQITDYKLQWTGSPEYTAFKQFHFFNNGLVSNDIPTNNFGFWENEETYPDKDDYNSLIDYNNNAIASGEDLRNTPIRYHRVPSLKSSYENGETELAAKHYAGGLYTDEEDTTYYNIGAVMENFGDIVPQEVKNQIQGYRLCFIQRDAGKSYVAGNWIRTRRGAQSTHPADIGEIDWGAYNLSNTSANPVTFGRGRVLGTELFKYKPTLDVTYIRNNYIMSGISSNEAVIAEDEFGECLSNLKYVPANNIVANSQYCEEGIDLDISDPNHMTITDAVGNKVSNITAFAHKTNLYSGFKSTSFVIMGKTSNLGNEIIFKGGDVFNETGVNVYLHSVRKLADGTGTVHKELLYVKGIFSPVNSSQLRLENAFDVDTYVIYDTNDANNVDSEYLSTLNYDFEVAHEADLSVVHNINTILSFDFEEQYVNKFPYRIHRGIKIPNENLSITSLRTYLISDYYEMPNDKGEIVALRGSERTLFIQHRFALFVASIKDKLQTQNIDAYLGRTDLFDRPPEEILHDGKGFVGCTSKFASVVIKGMYVVVNQVTGQIFILKDSIQEITKAGNKNWFWNNWDIGLDFYETDDNGEKRRIDNPYISVGHLIGYDKEYDRLLFTKKAYRYIGTNPATTFDGEFYTLNGTKLEYSDTDNFENLSKTLSYSLEHKAWAFEHDYFPNIIYHSFRHLHSITNKLNGTNRASVYQHNDKLTKGLFYGIKYDSYIDLIFNAQPNLSKIVKNVTWITDVINNNKGNEKFKTITHIMVYNNNQCSGIINLKDNHFDLTRTTEGDWSFNDFRDLVINPTNPILDDNGEVIDANINLLTLWFEKSNFIGKFITVRLIVDNIDNDSVYIHQVNVESILSKR